MNKNTSLLDLNSDIISNILSILLTLEDGKKSIVNLFYTFRKYRFANFEDRYTAVFMKYITFIAKSQNNLKEIEEAFYPNKLRNLRIKYDTKLNETDYTDNIIQKLSFYCYSFPFNNDLKIFSKITILHLGYCFDKNLGDSLHGLPITELNLGRAYDKPLYYFKMINVRISCLKGLPLKKLIFGEQYDKNLSDSLHELPLETIVFGYTFNQDLHYRGENNEIISCFRGLLQLNKISFGRRFNKKLYNDLHGLPLKEIYFTSSYNDDLDNSLEGLPLEKLYIYNQLNPHKFFNSIKDLPLRELYIPKCSYFYSYMYSENIYNSLPTDIDKNNYMDEFINSGLIKTIKNILTFHTLRKIYMSNDSKNVIEDAIKLYNLNLHVCYY